MFDHDVLIIGAGLAGMRAALSASQNGADVAVVTKVHPVRSHSNAAQGGINAALSDRGDDWRDQTADIQIFFGLHRGCIDGIRPGWVLQVLHHLSARINCDYMAISNGLGTKYFGKSLYNLASQRRAGKTVKCPIPR